jgi:hypothetical protein
MSRRRLGHARRSRQDRRRTADPTRHSGCRPTAGKTWPISVLGVRATERRTRRDGHELLGVHINAGLNVGLTAREVVEAIIHCIPYTGFPRVLNAIFVAKRVFEERDVDPLNDEA